MHQAYARDALGRIAELSETNALATTVTDYAYDETGRLTGESQNGRVRSYTYDANGNRLSVDDDGTVIEASYDAQDRILTYGTRSFTHDRRGNLTDITDGGAATHYTYDDLDRLTQVTLPDGRVIDYVIDAQGRRIARKLNGTLTAAYLYDGQLRPRAQLNAAGTITAEFVYANGINVPDAILTGGKTYALLRDHIGSVRLVVDSQTGAIAQQLAYDAFGQVTLDTSPGFQPFGFAGGLYDADTRLVHFGAREYEASIGRWISKDPILFWGRQVNLYVYAGSDPVNRVDPTGLIVPAVIASGAIGAVAGGVTYYLKTPAGCRNLGGYLGHIGGGFIAGAGIPFVGFGLEIGGGAGALVAFVGAGAPGMLGDVVKQATEGSGDVDYSRAAGHGAINVFGSVVGGAVAAESGGLGYLSAAAQGWLAGNVASKGGGYVYDRIKDGD